MFFLKALIIEFLGKFASTVKLSWKLWLVSIAIGFFRSPSLSVYVYQLPFFLLLLASTWSYLYCNSNYWYSTIAHIHVDFTDCRPFSRFILVLKDLQLLSAVWYQSGMVLKYWVQIHWTQILSLNPDRPVRIWIGPMWNARGPFNIRAKTYQKGPELLKIWINSSDMNSLVPDYRLPLFITKLCTY